MSVLPEKMVMISQVQNLKRGNISAYQIMKKRKDIKYLDSVYVTLFLKLAIKEPHLATLKPRYDTHTFIQTCVVVRIIAYVRLLDFRNLKDRNFHLI